MKRPDSKGLSSVLRYFSYFEDMFAWLGGAGLATLARCPDWEQRRYSVFGATVLVPTLFGGAAAGYATSTFTDSPWLIGLVAIIWGLVVLTIDRAFLAGYRASLPKRQKSVQFVLRFAIAVLMGMTVAHPLVLMLFAGGVDEQLRAEEVRRFDEAKQKAQAQIVIMSERIAELSKKKASLRSQFTDSLKPTDFSDEVDDIDSEPDWRTRLAMINQQIGSNLADIESLKIDIKSWRDAYQAEVTGNGASGRAGVGPAARRIQSEEIDWRVEQLVQLEKSLQNLQASKAAILADGDRNAQSDLVASVTVKTKLAELEAQQKSREFLRDDLQAQMAAISTEVTDLRVQRAAFSVDPKIEPLRDDLINRTLALHHLFKAEGGGFALSAYIVLSLVFVILDTIPIVVKFNSRPGPYDKLIEHQDTHFVPEDEVMQLAEQDAGRVVEAKQPVHHRKQSYNSRRKKIESAWVRRERKHFATKSLRKPDPTLTQADDVITKAKKLAEMREAFRSNVELSQAVGIKPTTLSKYFKLLKLPKSTQRDFASVTGLSLELAYRIACVDSQFHAQLLELCRSGAGQKQIREAIAGLKVGSKS